MYTLLLLLFFSLSQSQYVGPGSGGDQSIGGLASGDEGSEMDPDGVRATSGDRGANLDPDGLAAQGDGGPIMDPNG